MPRRWGAAGSTGACQLPALLDAADRGRQAVAQAGLPRRGGRVCPAAIRPRHDSVRRRGTRGAGARRCARSARAPPARVAAADAATAGGAVAGGRGSRRGHGARGGPRGVVPCCMSGYAVWQSALPHTGGAMPRLWPPQRLRRLLPGGQLKRRLLPAGRHKWQRGQPRRARAAGGAAVWLPGAEVAAAPWLRAAPAGGGACGAGRVQRPAGAAAAARHAWLESGGCGASVAGGADEAGAARCVHPPPARRCRPHRSRRRAAAAGARVAGGAGAACAAACGALASMPAGRADVVGFVAVARVSATRGAGGGAPGRVCGRSRECGRGRAHQGAGACGKGQESSGGRGSAALPSSPGCDEHARKECVGA
mmetsp:Transcript_14513/g.42332  ORF Transcript_14513/g.42332 Transcript_14513/m.42332 type:complete len:366 (-) Transcript_14513:79-1176(-)